MKTRASSLGSQSGSTYMTVVVTMIIVGAMLAAYLQMVSVQNQTTMRSQAWNRSVPVLEAGVEEALAHLKRNAAPDERTGVFNVNLASDGWQVHSNGGWYKIGELGEDSYYTRITSFSPGGPSGYFPFIDSVGFVKQLPTLSFNWRNGPLLAALTLEELQSSQFSKRVVVAGTTNVPTFAKGLVARRGIDMNGNNVYVDSFDSDSTTWSVNKRWSILKRHDRGDVASNDTITNALNLQNANIWGRVSTGPHGTVAIGVGGKVGDAAWQNDLTKSGIRPGYSTDDMNVQFPETVLPENYQTWVAPPSGSGYQMKMDVANATYLMTSEVNGDVLVAASNITLVVQGGWTFAGNDVMTIRTNGSIKIYLDCASADLTGKGLINTNGTAFQCQIFGTSKLKSLQIGGNGETTCVLYAPYADVTLNGGGSGDNDFAGAAIVNSAKFNGHFRFHYDEALGRMGYYRGYTLTSWQER